MDITPATPNMIRATPDPPPSDNTSGGVSPLEFPLALFAVVLIPTLIYTFFLCLKCPHNPFRRRQTSSSRDQHVSDDVITDGAVNFKKEGYVQSSNGGECVVCLSTFVDGEDVKELTVCKHTFHDSCIDMWLHSHASCPVCRAVVKEARGVSAETAADVGESDFRQGLPDSGSLV